MVADIDGDAARERLGRDAFRLCYDCGVTRRVVRPYRWTGTRLACTPLAFPVAGSAAAEAVSANDCAVTLARARRWAEAAAVLAAARPFARGNAVFRRNPSPIDLRARPMSLQRQTWRPCVVAPDPVLGVLKRRPGNVLSPDGRLFR